MTTQKIHIDIKKQLLWYAVYVETAKMYPNASIEQVVAHTNHQVYNK